MYVSSTLMLLYISISCVCVTDLNHINDFNGGTVGWIINVPFFYAEHVTRMGLCLVRIHERPRVTSLQTRTARRSITLRPTSIAVVQVCTCWIVYMMPLFFSFFIHRCV